MKKHKEASDSFFERLADAGLAALKKVGESMQEVGQELDDQDEPPLHVLGDAALGLGRAELEFRKGALAAASRALRIVRQKTATRASTDLPGLISVNNRPPVPRQLELYSADTLSLWGTASLDALRRLMAGTPYKPVELRREDELVGVAQVYVNKIYSSTLGAYEEMFLAASAVLEDQTGPRQELREDPHVLLLPGVNATEFVVRVVADGKDRDTIVAFGQNVLGTDKVAGKVTIKSVQKGWEFSVEEKGSAKRSGPLIISGLVGHVIKQQAAGAAPAPLPPPGPLRYSAAARPPKGQNHFKTWTWVIESASPPVISRIDPEEIKIGDGLDRLLLKIKFKPMLSAWIPKAHGLVTNLKEESGTPK